MQGIYAIVHKPTGARYVGQSINIPVRWAQHRRALRFGYHKNVLLARAWSKYGEAEFDFIVLEYCKVENLISREQFYLDQRAEFNLCRTVDAPPMTGRKHSAESKSKMKLRKHSEETRLRMKQAWETRLDKNPNKGVTLTPEHRAKLSAALKGRVLSPKTKAKMSAARKGKRKPPEFAEKVRAAKLGVPNTKVQKSVQCIETGQIFLSLKDAANHFQGSPTTLSKHLAGKLPRFRGYTFKKLQTNQKELRG